MLGGRDAEEMIYGETTTGPESDLQPATSLARQMFGRWGMTECADEAQRVLAEHREQVDHLAEALLEREALDESDAYAVAGIGREPLAEQPVAASA